MSAAASVRSVSLGRLWRTPALRRETAGLVAGALLMSWVAAFAWWWLLPASRTVDLSIPPGTAELVAAGQKTAISQALGIRIGDTLTVENLDGVVHRIGPMFIPPGARESAPVTAAFIGGGQLVCTVHPAGALSVTPRARMGIVVTIPVALMAGLPMSLAAILVVNVLSRLDRHPEDAINED